MFDLTSSKLLIVALVALIVVGPKDLPVLLRAIGKYVGIIRRQANEFRAYFDEAMKEQEIAKLREEMVAMKRDVQATVESAGRALESDIQHAKSDLDSVKGDLDRRIAEPAVPASAVPSHSPSEPVTPELLPVPATPVSLQSSAAGDLPTDAARAASTPAAPAARPSVGIGA
jgi:sec-independent protein translocase protein TatB